MANPVLVILLGLCAPLVYAGDDIANDVEQTMSTSDSQAVKDLARETRQEEADFRRAAVERERQAVVRRADDRAKTKKATRELGQNEREINRLKSRINAANAEIATSDAHIAETDKKLSAKRSEVDEAKAQLAAAIKQRDERRDRIAELNRKILDSQKERSRALREAAEAREDYKKREADEAREQARLKQNLKDNEELNRRLQVQMEALKASYRQTKNKTGTIDARVKDSRQRVDHSRENIEWAKAQIERKAQPKVSAAARPRNDFD